MEIIKFFNAPEFSQRVALDRKTCQLVIRYNDFSSCWEMDIHTAQTEPIITGICLLQGVLLLNQHIDSRLPAGDFFVHGKDKPNYENFVKGSVELIYITQAELERLNES